MPYFALGCHSQQIMYTIYFEMDLRIVRNMDGIHFEKMVEFKIVFEIGDNMLSP